MILPFILLAARVYADSLNDVEHILIFMQENRAFDHYFGTLQGVRGFNDRITVPLPSGLNSFYQPTDQKHLENYQLPYRADTTSTSAMCMDAPEMNYECDIRILNNGHYDSWNTARSPGTGMSYFTREDLPYYYTLYDNFATGDQYFQSTFTQTNPNRLHLFSGSNGLSVGEKAMLDNTEPRPGFNWTTVAELLEEAHISWRVYQQVDNFDDNGFAWFSSFQQSRPGDPLFDKGMVRQKNLIDAFSKDMKNNNLPAVSWIIAPTSRSEHASHHPSIGENFTSSILATLQQYPDVYAKSVFILNYDEGGQFFDHSWTPTPPLSPSEGISTCSVEGEVNSEVKTTVPAPIGLGFRVPLLIVSPWTRGNIVFSEVMDHTSVIQLIEKRFGVYCPNISPWRRAVTGDMLAAFDFEHPDYSWPVLPDTSNYVEESFDMCKLPYPVVPDTQSYPKQESGTRISRALPYEFVVSDTVTARDGQATFTLGIDNTGEAGAPFILYDMKHLSSSSTVRKYAVESGKFIEDALLVSETSGEYGFSLLGPNGFARQFFGFPFDGACAGVSSTSSYDPINSKIKFSFQNGGASNITFQIIDNAYGSFEVKSVVVGGESAEEFVVDVSSTGNWYDVSVSVTNSNSQTDCYIRRYAGRMETGRDTTSDPALSGNVLDVNARHPVEHPKVPDQYRYLKKYVGESVATAGHKDAAWFYKSEPNVEL